MCEAKMYYILRELGTLGGVIEIYNSIRGTGGKRVIEVVEDRMDELLQQYDAEEIELEQNKKLQLGKPLSR